MSFEKLEQINATDLIGGSNNLQLLSYLKHLSETAHQMSLKNSKPFQTKGEVLIPSTRHSSKNHVANGSVRLYAFPLPASSSICIRQNE